MIQQSESRTLTASTRLPRHTGTVLWIVLVALLLPLVLWKDVSRMAAGVYILSAQSAQRRGDLQTMQIQLARAGFWAPDLPQLSSQRLYADLDLLQRAAANISFAQEEELAASTYSPGLNNAAVLAFADGDLAGSKTLLERAALLNPESAQVQYNLGVVAYHSGEMEAARLALQRASLLAPDWPQPPLYLAATLIQINDLASAQEAARAGVALAPTVRPAHLALLYTCLMLQQIDDGLAATEQALQSFPHDPAFLFYQGLFLRSTGDKDQAFAVLQRAFFLHQEEDQRRRIAQELLHLMKGE